MHKFNLTGIFKIASHGNFVATFACLILARNYNSPRTVSVKVLTLAVFILLRLVFTSDGVRVRVLIKRVELFDLVKTVF